MSPDDESGNLWVEYWEASLEESASPVREETYRRLGEAQVAILLWLVP